MIDATVPSFLRLRPLSLGHGLIGGKLPMDLLVVWIC